MHGDENSEVTKLTRDNMDKIEHIPSIPFQVNLNIPVVNVACGDLFNSILTAEGEVYSWGYNLFG